MMYIPLYCVFVVKVYQNSRRDETLVPKTMTELYFSLIHDLLRCHHNDDLEVHSFNDLSKDAPDIYQQLCILGKIAYEGIRNDQQVIFHRKDFETMGLSLKNFETLGLMRRVRELYVGEATAVSCNFLHLTVQEYLAAFHLSRQPVEKQIETLSVYAQKRHFQMVLRFLCGISKFKGYLNEQQLIEDSGYDSASGIRKVTFDTLHWLFEAHDSKVIAKVLGSSDIQLHGQFRTVTPFDCFVLGYCVSHSNCTWKIDLGYCHIGDEGVEMLVRGAVEEETHCTGGFSEMKLSGNDVTSEGVKHLLSFPKQSINILKALNLSPNKLDSESCAVLAHLIPHMPHLRILNLSDNHNIGQGGTVPLITSLTAHNSLEELELGRTGIGMEDCRALSELLSSSTSLKKLHINGNDLPPEAVELIISGLNHNTTLKWLNMGYSHYSLQNTISLASVLRTNHTLVDLGLGRCNIDSDGACQLASALCTNDTLQKLDLSGNPIGVKEAFEFAEMLRTNHTLVDLCLECCNIDSDGGCQLASALCTNDTLQVLNLWGNPVGVKGATAFAEMLRTNHTLVDLNLQLCNIDSDGGCQLASALCTNDTLQKLNLWGNPIGVRGATAFAETLRTNCTLVYLSLGHCEIDSDGACQFASALCTNDILQKLYLWDNPIGVKGATAFAEMLLKNKSLKVLKLLDDSIGEEGTQKLIDSLTHNTTVKELVLPKKYESSVASSGVDSSRIKLVGFYRV